MSLSAFAAAASARAASRSARITAMCAPGSVSKARLRRRATARRSISSGGKPKSSRLSWSLPDASPSKVSPSDPSYWRMIHSRFARAASSTSARRRAASARARASAAASAAARAAAAAAASSSSSASLSSSHAASASARCTTSTAAAAEPGAAAADRALPWYRLGSFSVGSAKQSQSSASISTASAPAPALSAAASGSVGTLDTNVSASSTSLAANPRASKPSYARRSLVSVSSGSAAATTASSDTPSSALRTRSSARALISTFTARVGSSRRSPFAPAAAARVEPPPPTTGRLLFAIPSEPRRNPPARWPLARDGGTKYRVGEFRSSSWSRKTRTERRVLISRFGAIHLVTAACLLEQPRRLFARGTLSPPRRRAVAGHDAASFPGVRALVE